MPWGGSHVHYAADGLDNIGWATTPKSSQDDRRLGYHSHWELPQASENA